MTLSVEQKRQNKRELQSIIDNLLLICGKNELLRQKLNRLLEISENIFDQYDIICSIPNGKKAFHTLLDRALFAAMDERKFVEDMKAWAEAYKMLEEKATADQHQIFTTHRSQGIISSLISSNSSAEMALGDERDIVYSMGELIKDPGKITTHGIYVLPPVSISPGFHASDEEINQPHQFIKSHIKTVRDNNSNQEQPIRLLTQVCGGQNHWYVADVTLNKGEITSATLYDPKKREVSESVDFQDAIENTPAFNCFNDAVKELNLEFKKDKKERGLPSIQDEKAVIVNAIALNKQTDGVFCMDYTEQHILKLLPPEQVKKAGLEKIRDAETGIRTAMIATIIKNYPKLNTSNEEIKREIEQVFNPEVEVKKDFHDTFKVYSGQDSDAAKQAKEVQILYDALLAQHFAELEPEEDEEKMWRVATQSTFQVFQNRYGFFKPDTESNQVAQDLDLPADRLFKI